MATNSTRTYMNWVNVSVTPRGGTAIAIKSVTAVKVNRDSKQEDFYGDNRSFARVKRSTERERGITIMTGDLGVLYAIPDGTPCTVQGTCLDPINLATPGGGAFTTTLINAVMMKNDNDAQNNKFGGGTVSFSAYADEDASGVEIDPMTTVYL